MIIYDNIIFSLQRAGGISIYWAELIKRLVKIETNTTFFEAKNENIFRNKFKLQTKTENSFISIKILRYLPFLKKLSMSSIFHSSYYRVSLQKNVINITTVHDFTYEYFRSGVAKKIHVWQKGFAIKKSDGIICVSENTKKDLIKFYPNIETSKIKVIYNGVSDEILRLENPKEYLVENFKVLKNKKFILYIGDRSSYKNFDIVVKVLEKLDRYSLVVVGGKEFNDAENVMMKDIKKRVIHFRGICGNELNTLYNNAFCLLYPSSYEGFGIPIAEAMKAGCPVVSTNISSIPEVAGNAGLLVNKISVNNFVKEIRKLEKDEIRNLLIKESISQSKKFNWNKCFEETYEYYNLVWNKTITARKNELIK